MPVARNTSAIFIAIFLFDFEFDWENKTRRISSPGVDSGLSPRPVAVMEEVGKYLCFGRSPDVSFVG